MTDPNSMNDERRNRDLRVSVHDGDLRELMIDYPKLARAEIVDAITRAGPIRADVEAELRRLSEQKR
jgi:hypothetical protein